MAVSSALKSGTVAAPPALPETCDGIAGAIGNTPLIKLKRASEVTGCLILGKAEFMNPGQSVKDRAALFIIEDAVKSGALRPGGVIVEGTAGNTGIGLTIVGRAMGFRSVIVIPETQSQEKKDMLRLCGAELVEVPAVPYKNPNNYVKVSGRLAAQLAKSQPSGAIWANQFDNVANRDGHIRTTGPEIWKQTAGTVDGFVCAVGTGGTLAGVGMALKDRNPNIKIALADPEGAALYSYYTTGGFSFPGLVRHRRDRAGAHHQEPGERADRPRLSDPRRRSAAYPLRPGRARGARARSRSSGPRRGRGARASAHHRPGGSFRVRARARSGWR